MKDEQKYFVLACLDGNPDECTCPDCQEAMEEDKMEKQIHGHGTEHNKDEDEDEEYNTNQMMWHMVGPLDTKELAAEKIQEAIHMFGAEISLVVIKGTMVEVKTTMSIGVKFIEPTDDNENILGFKRKF